MNRMRAALFFLAAVVAGTCVAQRGGDMQAQILYAYQTEDLNRLRDLAQGLAAQVAAGGGGAALRYDLAHADYRYAELELAHHPARAEAAAADCTGELKALLARSPGSVEALALQSACDSQLAGLRRFEAVFYRHRADELLRRAYGLAPDNPRVVFIMAQTQLARARPGSTQYAQALARLRTATGLFTRSPATRSDAPGWGHAEAYLALGHELLNAGDVLGARNWIERSLIAAPDYKAARRELARLQARSAGAGR